MAMTQVVNAQSSDQAAGGMAQNTGPYSPVNLAVGSQDQRNANNQSGNYYQRDNGGNVWMRPYGGNNTQWQYGAQAPQAGVDQRAWTNVNNPLAFEYGGQYGGAQGEESRYAQLGQSFKNNAAPQMTLDAYQNDLGYGEGGAGTAADAQYAALDQARMRAQGMGGPSVAEQQLNQSLGQAQRLQFQMAAQARGGGAQLAAANQTAANEASNLQAQGIGQAATLRAQEQLANEQAFAQQAAQMRGQALQQAGMSAQLAYQQAGLQGQQNALNQQGLLASEAMRQGVFNAQLGAQQAGEAQNAGVGMQQAQLAWQQQQAQNQFYRQLLGGAMTAGGAMLAGPAGAAGGGMAAQAIAGSP